MVFSSPEFIFIFLPVAILGYYVLIRMGFRGWVFLFIVFISLIYYAWWRFDNIYIIIFSILFNFLFGKVISSADEWRKSFFVFSIAVNLAALLYFKYTIFSIESYNYLTSSQWPIPEIILPIGISFFTFQQIAYLSDIYTKKYDPTSEGLVSYSLFVCFFPQLVAGPIVHHAEMMPQFDNSITTAQVNWENIYKGLVLFGIGLSKKVLVADTLSHIVGFSFDESSTLTFCEAAFGALCYSLQLYFDFSGYSDMAVGCALMLNIRLPWNFNSPYKSLDIQDFWRRWHMTLSRWLRDYLYIPLGGNRKGYARTLLNLFIAFLLGGLWHGAAWTFVIWGGMHGAALVVHRLWRRCGCQFPKLIGWFLTFSFVNIAWIVFRAKDIDCIKRFAVALTGGNGWLPSGNFKHQMWQDTFFPNPKVMLIFVLSMLTICLLGRNSRELLENPESKCILLIVSFLFGLSMLMVCIPDKTQEFIYFQF